MQGEYKGRAPGDICLDIGKGLSRHCAQSVPAGNSLQLTPTHSSQNAGTGVMNYLLTRLHLQSSQFLPQSPRLKALFPDGFEEYHDISA